MNRLFFYFLTAIALLFGACSKNDGTDDSSPDPGATEKFVIAGTAATAEQDKQYLFLSDDLDQGEITVKGNGYETQGSVMFALNNKVFSFKYNKGDPGLTEVFQLNEKSELQKVSSFSVKSVNVFLPYQDQQHLLAYNIGRALTTDGSAYWLNTETNTVERDAQIDQKVIDVDGKHIDNYYAFMYAFFEFGDRIYAVYKPTYGGSGDQVPLDYTDRAFVSIFDKDMNFIKTISDKRMPYIGKYYNPGCGLGQTNDGAIYAFSSVAIQSENNHTAFLKISDEAFDQDYYWDVEAESGKQIFAGKYLGNNKFILALVDRDATKVEAEGVKLAIADPTLKSFTWVSGVDEKIPGSAYDIPLFIQNQKAYIALSPEQTSVSYLYVIDPENATAKRGLTLTGIKDITGVGILTTAQ